MDASLRRAVRLLKERNDAIEKTVADLHQRLAKSMLPGKVKEVDPAKYRVLLVLATNEDGTEVLSPWVKWQSGSAGKVRDWSPPEVGEEMLLLSPSGVVGTGSRAMFGTFDDDHPAPSSSGDERVWKFGDFTLVVRGDRATMTVGDAKFEMTGEKITHSIGGTSHELTAGGLKATADDYQWD